MTELIHLKLTGQLVFLDLNNFRLLGKLNYGKVRLNNREDSWLQAKGKARAVFTNLEVL